MNKHIVNILVVMWSWTIVAGASADAPADVQSEQYTDAAGDADAKIVGNRHGRETRTVFPEEV